MREDLIVRETPHRRLAAGTPLARGLIFVLFGLGLTQDQLRRGDPGLVAGLVLAAVVLGLGYGAVSWWLTRWWLTPDELRIDTGVLRRVSRRIRIDRIQEIDVVKPIGARVLGLAEVRLDVAGSPQGDSLAFLGRHEAQELKDALMRRRSLVAPGRPTPDGTAVDGAEGDPGSSDQGGAVVELGRVGAARLVAASATSLPAVGLLLLTPVLVWTQGLSSTLPALALLPVMGSLGVWLTRDVAEGWGFRLTEDHLGLHVRRGLLDVSHQTIATHRLQGLRISEPVVWRLAGWARLDVATAGALGVGANGPDASTVLSVGDRAHVVALASALLGRDVGAVAMSPVPRRAHLLGPLRARTLGFVLDASLVGSRSGWWVRRTQLVPHARVQSLRMRQGPLQRRLGLATVVVDSPEGPVRVVARHRPVAEARALLDTEVAVARAAREAARDLPPQVRRPSPAAADHGGTPPPRSSTALAG